MFLFSIFTVLKRVDFLLIVTLLTFVKTTKNPFLFELRIMIFYFLAILCDKVSSLGSSDSNSNVHTKSFTTDFDECNLPNMSACHVNLCTHIL